MTDTTGHAGITGLLQAVEQGDRDALNALFPLVYEELSTLARQHRRVWMRVEIDCIAYRP